MAQTANPLSPDRFIYRILTTGTGTTHTAADLTAIIGDRIKPEVAPREWTHPYLLYADANAGGQEVYATGEGGAIFLQSTYRIWAVHETDSYGGVLATIDAIVRDLLETNHAGPAGSGYVYSVVRTGPYRMPEFTEGRQYMNLGGFWEILSI